MLLRCNDSLSTLLPLCAEAFLPTMKSQLSQLPMIVGSGRVIFDAPFFLVRAV
jgi:hypothetical protein